MPIKDANGEVEVLEDNIRIQKRWKGYWEPLVVAQLSQSCT